MYIDLTNENEDDVKLVNLRVEGKAKSEMIDICDATEECRSLFSLSNIKGEEIFQQENIEEETYINNDSNNKKEHFNKYKTIIETKNFFYPSSALCDVCLTDYGEESDELIFCDFCYSAVHQSCYGSEILSNLPNSEWYCQRCISIMRDNKQPINIRCYFCPEMRGIIKNVLPQSEIGINAKIWAHVSCVNWIKEIYFIDEKKEITHFKYDKSRFGIYCNICESILGSCIQCDFKKCKQNFHVSCAQREGLIESSEVMDSLQIDDYFIPVFCRDHKELVSTSLVGKDKNASDLLKKYIKHVKFYKQIETDATNKSTKKKNKLSKRTKKIKKSSKTEKKRIVFNNNLQENNTDELNKEIKENIERIENEIMMLSRKKTYNESLSEVDLQSWQSQKKKKKKKKERLITMKLDSKPRKRKLKEITIDGNNKSNKISLNKKENKNLYTEENKINENEITYNIPKVFLNLIGIKDKVFMTLNKFQEKFINTMIKSDCYDYENDYILLFKNTILHDIFLKEIMKTSEIRELLNEKIIEYNSQLQENQHIQKNILLDSSSDSEESSIGEELNLQTNLEIDYGWNIVTEFAHIDSSNLHSSYIVSTRNFFIKEKELHIFRSEDCINLCFE